MSEIQRRIDEIRFRNSEVENHLIDSYRGGSIDRREFVRRGSVLGMSLGSLGFLASACGSGKKDSGGDGESSASSSDQLSAKVKPGGKVTVGINSPAGAIDPFKVADDGGVAVLAQASEYLVWSDSKLNAVPRLAVSWKPNADASEWTFKIRQGVKFHDGTPMTAEDVAESINRLADPKSGSQALSAFNGVIGKDSAKATDANTVVFSLDSPNGNFPYLLSSDNYNTVILPKTYNDNYEKNWTGTGPFKIDMFNQGESATFVKNPDYWDKGRQPNPDNTEIRFYAKEEARVFALQSGEIDAVVQFSAGDGRALLTDPNVQTVELLAATHRQVHMRTDRAPFRDKRTRQAMALLLDRQGMVQGLFQGKAKEGNDSPFSPLYKYTAKDVAQRQQDIAKAKQLLSDAGQSGGFTVELDTWDGFEIPDLAQLIQSNAKQAGINIQLEISDSSTYYGDAAYGKSRWLDSTMGITDYGHRGVVNVFLGAPLQSNGTWNSAHFRNPQYDKLVKDFTAQLDIPAQTRVAKQIQELLLDETPIMIPYFYDFLTGVRKGIGGVETTAMAHVQLTRAGKTIA
ncbi:MAG: ABC transporter substrate-binding protein [Geodermatophilaceae bacterium]|nr:ABC transporter substrate-binding protein [Geodermatophilaceae bacterium]